MEPSGEDKSILKVLLLIGTTLKFTLLPGKDLFAKFKILDPN
jgi:hypothetical protein